ncbi:Centrosome and spindle pole-associated protein 1 [Merluccius polli]|uniref:Centrosome and spindle pole-associated protein 1 n=1 Tax=Merluccius polli TaxID=89951 RepID=A0AA47M6L0_MERPO|nr:Centrosome and spindle pole-associated protein 1 [Merluccius polli]
MKAYEPWGRGGAGAPIRDKGGNLISDLNKMHRTNENAYINSEGRDRTAAEPSQNAAAPPDEDGAHNQSQHQQTPGVPPGQTAHSARGKAFPEEPAPRKVLEQNHYRHFLELQMEEKRSRQAEEREEARREEERAERRMAEDRARMQTEFQQEQEKKRRKGMDQSRSNEELMRQAEERRRRAGRWREEEERERERERESEALRQRRERERQESVVQRGPSPLIPTLQRKLGKLPNPGSPPAAGQHTSATLSERSTPAPYSPPVPARRNELRAKGGAAPPEDRQEVMRELSALRRHLSAERHRVERLAQREETHTPPPRELQRRTCWTWRGCRRRRRWRGGRDTASRAEVRYVYPDPPSDELSLDIQQQALLREQQRRTLRTHTHTGQWCTHTHTHTHTFTYAYRTMRNTQTCRHTHTHTHINIHKKYTCTHLQACTHTVTHRRKHTCRHTYADTHMHILTHMHTHTYRITRTPTHTCCLFFRHALASQLCHPSLQVLLTRHPAPG